MWHRHWRCMCRSSSPSSSLSSSFKRQAKTLCLVLLLHVRDLALPCFSVDWSKCAVTCCICWMCGIVGERVRARNGFKREASELPVEGTTSLLSGFPRVQFDRAVAMKVMPLSAIFVSMIIGNQLTLKHVQVSFYNVARCARTWHPLQ